MGPALVAVGCSAPAPPAAGPAPQVGSAASAEVASVTAVAPSRSGEDSSGAEAASVGEPPAGAPPAAPGPPPSIPPGTAVLHIGDSFALAGFAQSLRPRMLALGVRYEVRAETSSFTTTWSGKLELMIANTQPDLVIINLGANEMSNIDPSTHAPAVRHLVKVIGGRPCVWVSPPTWRKDTGILDVIRENSAPCRFFDSDVLVTRPIPRQGDHIHPNDQGGAIWADAFWAWLATERAPDDADAPRHRSPWTLKPSPPEEHLRKAAATAPR